MEGEREWGKGNKINTKQYEGALVQRLLSPSETFTVPWHNKQEGDKWAKHKYGCCGPTLETKTAGNEDMAQGQKKKGSEIGRGRSLFIFSTLYFKNFPINLCFFFQEKNILILKKKKTLWRWQAQADVGGRAHKLFNEVNKESKPEDGEVQPGPKIGR